MRHSSENTELTIRGTSQIARTLVCACLLLLLLAALGYFFHGKTGVEKSLTRLSMPLGLAWLLLSGWIVQRLGVSGLRGAAPAALAWLAFTLCSLDPVRDLATRYLESRIPPAQLSKDDPLDVVVVLGGGTNRGPNRAQAASSGDRVVYAAQLYHQGLTKGLITTGDSIRSMTGQEIPDPSEQTVEIWTALGIPRRDISTLPGINTYREVASLAEAMQAELAGKRVGVLTSATHLPRALRLARARGLDGLTFIGADYRGLDQPRTFVDWLPSADALAQLARCQHEFLAGLVAR